ncbi:hypothetical protein F5148DRAFT_194849 [Russula earlei]|uniref:Uncharacterized protein n=1 Tax=Russula earlei TaxID=71964 RepID=A0ACC0U6Q5_9AGAM|nr:hypothetical protein F5148DRAFT_194849 [Russula earlei]
MNVSPPVYTAVDPNTREIPSFNSSQPLSQPGPTASVSSPQSITHSRGSQMNDDVGTIPSGPSGSRHGETGGTPHSRPNDILVDGFLAHTFSSHDAHNFLSLLLRTPNFLQHYDLSYSQGAWYFMPKAPYVQPPSRGIPIQNSPLLIDFSVATTRGTVVPQRRWTPTDEVDVRRHVESAALQLPIFFINRRGGVGFRLLDILQGRDRDLDHGDREAPLGGRTTTHIRINWPSYGDWKRQIPAKDETYSRNPITLARFMRHVGTSVDKFFNQCMASDHVADPRWRIGMQGITQSDVKIIGAVHVSSGTWMPIIQLARYVL